MMIPVLTLYIALALGAGAYLGYGAGERAVPGQEVLSYRETASRMRQCRSFCGRDRTAGFDAISGECSCHRVAGRGGK